MKAIKKPIPIEIEEFQPHRRPWPICVEEGETGSTMRYCVVNKLHGSRIGIKPGDFINVSDKTGTDIYPIDRDTFMKTYDIIE